MNDRALSRRKRLLLDLVDLLSLVSEGRPITTEDLWTRVLGREGYDERQAERHFRALADLVHELGFKLSREPSDGESGLWGIVFDQPAETWDAVNGELASLSGVREPERQEKTKKRVDRKATTKEVEERFGVKWSSILYWIKKGLPHSVERFGKVRKRHLFNIEEVENWLKARTTESPSTGKYQVERTPSSEATPRLRVVKDKLNLSRVEMAKLLEISENTLSDWLTGKTATIPEHYVALAESLVDVEEKRLSKIRPVTRSEVEAVLKATRSKSEAARRLKVSYRFIDDLIEKYDLEGEKDWSPVVTRFYPGQVREVMKRADNVLYKAAKFLGISIHAMIKLIREYGLEGEFEIRERGKTIGCEELEKAIEETGGIRREVGEKLGKSRGSVTKAARRCGLDHLLVDERALWKKPPT